MVYFRQPYREKGKVSRHNEIVKEKEQHEIDKIVPFAGVSQRVSLYYTCAVGAEAPVIIDNEA